MASGPLPNRIGSWVLTNCSIGSVPIMTVSYSSLLQNKSRGLAQDEASGDATLSVNVSTFLSQLAATFLDRGQDWYQMLARWYSQMSFERGSPSHVDLDRIIRPEIIREIDFERGETRTRAATD